MTSAAAGEPPAAAQCNAVARSEPQARLTSTLPTARMYSRTLTLPYMAAIIRGVLNSKPIVFPHRPYHSAGVSSSRWSSSRARRNPARSSSAERSKRMAMASEEFSFFPPLFLDIIYCKAEHRICLESDKGRSKTRLRFSRGQSLKQKQRQSHTSCQVGFSFNLNQVPRTRKSVGISTERDRNRYLGAAAKAAKKRAGRIIGEGCRKVSQSFQLYERESKKRGGTPRFLPRRSSFVCFCRFFF